jgi:alpha-L-rhamnosidase
VRGDTQAGYALALSFDLIDDPLRPVAATHLLEAIQKYRGHASTGIHATHRLMLALSSTDHHDEAWRLINLRTVPSWGYMVDHGATTIWERWDAYIQGVGPWGGFQHPDMNSFNHLSLGSVGEWIWRELAGINPDDVHPGYKHIVLRPRACSGLNWVKASYDSVRGPIVSEWAITFDRFQWHLEIPANCTATVYVPGKKAEAIIESGKPAVKADKVSLLREEADAVVFKVESGRYDFRADSYGSFS